MKSYQVFLKLFIWIPPPIIALPFLEHPVLENEISTPISKEISVMYSGVHWPVGKLKGNIDMYLKPPKAYIEPKYEAILSHSKYRRMLENIPGPSSQEDFINNKVNIKSLSGTQLNNLDSSQVFAISPNTENKSPSIDGPKSFKDVTVVIFFSTIVYQIARFGERLWNALGRNYDE